MFEGLVGPHGRGHRARADGAVGHGPARPVRDARRGGLRGRRPALRREPARRLQPRPRRHPGRPRVAAVVEDAVNDLGAAGATGRPRVAHAAARSARAGGDVVPPHRRAQHVQGVDGFAAAGIDLLADHHSELPAHLLRWLDEAQTMSVREYVGLQTARTEVYDMLQGVFADHDLLVTPTVGCLPWRTRARRARSRLPDVIEGVKVDGAIGWTLTYPANFTGIPRPPSRPGRSTGFRSACRSWAGWARTATSSRPPAPWSGYDRGATRTRCPRGGRSHDVRVGRARVAGPRRGDGDLQHRRASAAVARRDGAYRGGGAPGDRRRALAGPGRPGPRHRAPVRRVRAAG